MAMVYEDFTIDIRSAAQGGFEARVVAAPLQESPGVFFSPPLDETTLRAVLEAGGKPAGSPEASKVSSCEIGLLLFTTLMQGEVGDLFERCRARLPGDGSAGLRLRLHFLLSDPAAGYLAALPWEWLWNPRTRSFLATERSTPVVRTLAVPFPGAPLGLRLPLRVLVVDAAPGTMHALDLTLEIERLREALAPLLEAGKVELLHLASPTPEALRDLLLAEEIHVLHFMGHGGYHEGSGYGAVFFVRPDGKEDQVDGTELADYLKDVPGLRLVVLNACQTARLAGRVAAPLHDGVASALLGRQGVPAVVANQHVISDEAAIAFASTFYGRLAEGDDVDAALTEVRLRLKRTTREWATPVLFLAKGGVRIFALKPAGRGKPTRARRPPRRKVEPVRLGIRSFIGYGADMEERTDAPILDLSGHFDGRFIRDPKSWQAAVFPELRAFLKDRVDPHRPVLLDLAAHASIAFAAGWLLEAKSGLDVRVRQRVSEKGELEWGPNDGTAGNDGERLWLERPDVLVRPGGCDVALSLAVSQPNVRADVEEYLRQKDLPVGRILDAVIAPEPGPRSVRGGAHCLRLAQALLPRLRERQPHERSGALHLFCAGPNAFLVYLGQLARCFDRLALYEFAFGAPDNFGRYQRSIELPPPEERRAIPESW